MKNKGKKSKSFSSLKISIGVTFIFGIFISCNSNKVVIPDDKEGRKNLIKNNMSVLIGGCTNAAVLMCAMKDDLNLPCIDLAVSVVDPKKERRSKQCDEKLSGLINSIVDDNEPERSKAIIQELIDQKFIKND